MSEAAENLDEQPGGGGQEPGWLKQRLDRERGKHDRHVRELRDKWQAEHDEAVQTLASEVERLKAEHAEATEHGERLQKSFDALNGEHQRLNQEHRRLSDSEAILDRLKEKDLLEFAPVLLEMPYHHVSDLLGTIDALAPVADANADRRMRERLSGPRHPNPVRRQPPPPPRTVDGVPIMPYLQE